MLEKKVSSSSGHLLLFKFRDIKFGCNKTIVSKGQFNPSSW